jgi:hypothetical protein
MNHSTIPDFLLNDIIKRALEEDLGGVGDHNKSCGYTGWKHI